MRLATPTLMTLWIVLSAVFAACNNAEYNPQLSYIDMLADTNFQAANDSLTKIKRSTLNKANRYYYDLLTIKMADKSNKDLKNDSLMREIVEFFKDSDNDTIYSEALYYCGRVYASMGDYPTALTFFKKSEDVLPDSRNLLIRKGNLYSQIANIYSRLKIYREAISYCNKMIQLDSLLDEPKRTIWNLRLTGHMYLEIDSLDEAERYFTQSLDWAYKFSQKDTIPSKACLASLYARKHNYKRALSYIRNLPQQTPSLFRDYILAQASEIYLKSGFPDSAYLYIKQLILSDNQQYKRNAYSDLLNESMRHHIPQDSLYSYINEYRRAMETFNSQHDAEAVLIQNSILNYNLHDRQREEAEKRADKFMYWLMSAVIFILICTVVALIISNNTNKKLIRYRETLDRLRLLNRKQEEDNKILSAQIEEWKSQDNNPQESLETYNEQSNENLSKIQNPSDKSGIDTVEAKIEEELDKIRERINRNPGISHVILQSETYQELMDIIKDEKPIGDHNNLWSRLEDLVISASPSFKTNIRLFMGKEPSELAYRLAILIKCGVSASQSAILISREKNTISYYRRNFKQNIIYSKLAGEFDIDAIIAHL